MKPVEKRGPRLRWVAPADESFAALRSAAVVPLVDMSAGEWPAWKPQPFFVDWLSIKQTHEHELPQVCAGVVWAADESGAVQWKTVKAKAIEGSHETSVQIRCDGQTVTFSGNVSRFGRTDNLFGYDLAGCIRRVNSILARLGLPPFTIGQKFYRHVKTQGGVVLKSAWTGATISRIDLTANYETGSLSNARAYLEWLATQQGNARLKVGTSPDGETVDWGKGSRSVYSKIYLKSAELRKHDGRADLIEHCEKVGLVRFEVTVKSTQLHSMGCNYLGGLDMTQLEILFNQRASVLTRAEHTHDDLEELPNHLRRTARDYLAGDDLSKRMSSVTFWRHRKGLLPYGLDIAVRRNVINFQPRVKVIELRPAAVPSWYQLDERLAA